MGDLSGVFKGGPLRLPLGIGKKLSVFITHKRKTYALIVGISFVNMYLRLLLPEVFFSSKCTKYIPFGGRTPPGLGRWGSL